MNNSNFVDDEMEIHIEEKKRRRALLEIQIENMKRIVEEQRMRRQLQQMNLNGNPKDDDHDTVSDPDCGDNESESGSDYSDDDNAVSDDEDGEGGSDYSDDDNAVSDNEESESECECGSDYSEMTDTDEPPSNFWLYKFTDISDASISNEEDQPSSSNDKYDLSKDALQRAPLPPPSLGGFKLLPRPNDKSIYARLRRDADIVLKEYNMREGVEYEYVKAIRSIATRSPDNPDQIGQHMNFWARRKFTFTPPELFFGSVSYGMKGSHGCKLNLDPDSHGETPEFHEILHCKHVKCSECSLWKSQRA